MCNIAIIGDRDIGKTTYLKKKLNEYLNLGYKIIVIDSANHKEKSIIEYIKINFKDFLLIEYPKKDSIFNLSKIESQIYNIGNIYPYHLIKKNLNQIICIDVSRFIEEGYETEDIMFYKKLAVQCLKVIYEFLGKESIVIMDEIEFIPDMKKMIKLYNSKGIGFNIAIDDLNSLSTSKDLFLKMSIGEKSI